MRAIIPVAGVGTRLRPHTYTLPKVLLNVAGKPILAHILDRLIVQGISKATIVTGYMGKLVQEYVNANYSIDISFVPQRESLGLGHAIWVARETFGDEPLMIILGDTIFDTDVGQAVAKNYSSIAVKKVEDPRRYGVVDVDSEGMITGFIEKPEVPLSNLAIVGIYYISNPNLLKKCLGTLIDKQIKTRDEFQLTDALQLMLDQGEKFATFQVDGWYDCGKPETMLETNKFLLETNATETSYISNAVIIPPVFIAKDADVTHSIIGPYATVASGAVVRDSIVRNSIISDGASVYSSLLNDSIIGNNAVVKGYFFKLNVGNSSEINFDT